MPYVSENQEVAWNLSQAIIEEISLLLNSAILNYTNYKYEESFRRLKAIKLIIIANLNADERKAFLDKEKDLSNIFGKKNNTYSGFNLLKQFEFSKIHGSDLIKKLDSYSELLMDTLKKYGYLIPPKEDKKNLNK